MKASGEGGVDTLTIIGGRDYPTDDDGDTGNAIGLAKARAAVVAAFADLPGTWALVGYGDCSCIVATSNIFIVEVPLLARTHAALHLRIMADALREAKVAKAKGGTPSVRDPAGSVRDNDDNSCAAFFKHLPATLPDEDVIECANAVLENTRESWGLSSEEEPRTEREHESPPQQEREGIIA